MKRRKFMKCVAATGASILVPIELFKQLGISFAGGNPSRYLINLVGSGGWDSSWFHNTMSFHDLDGVPGSFVSSTDVGFEFAQSNQPFMLSYKGGAFPESSQLWTHPDGKTLLGPAMKFVFNSPSELSDLLIWRGLNPAGGHTIGNQLILQGNASSYALSYSAIVAGATAQDSLKPLHYLMLSPDPRSLFTSANLNSGAQIPICVSDITQFVSMTQTSADDLASSGARKALQAAVDSIGKQALPSGLTLDSNRTLASTFDKAFDASTQIYGSSMLQSQGFLNIFNSYLTAVFAACGKAAADANIQNKLGIAAFSYGYKTTYLTILEDLVLLSAQIGKLSVLDWIGGTVWNGVSYQGPYTPTWLGSSGLLTQIYNFALAEFVVSNDISAVVDLPAWSGLIDAHGGPYESYTNELLVGISTWSCLRNLIRNLKSKQPYGGGAGSLYDQTLVVLNTEFDRLPHQTVGDGTYVPGTNHGNTASLILAGYGVNNGKVVGDFNRGPNVHAPSTWGPGYLTPLPTNLDSGQPDPAGVIMDTQSVLPTIVQAFGATVPSRQTTDHNVVNAILKKS